MFQRWVPTSHLQTYASEQLNDGRLIEFSTKLQNKGISLDTLLKSYFKTDALSEFKKIPRILNSKIFAVGSVFSVVIGGSEIGKLESLKRISTRPFSGNFPYQNFFWEISPAKMYEIIFFRRVYILDSNPVTSIKCL